MLKTIILKICQRKINRLKFQVKVILNKEIPTPALKEVAKLTPLVGKVNSFEKELESKPPEYFKQKTQEFKRLIQEKISQSQPEELKEMIEAALDDKLPFYFALVREAARRTVKMRHFDVQILGGLVLHKNKIAEMVTGEGKTLVATLAASLNALVDQGVHIVTVNDYLAKRDSEWMGPIYEYLGFSVGVIQQDMDSRQRRAAYACDITYGTNNEFGFDYLRDNMATNPQNMVQRRHWYAVVDEVDSILIDEARTPLIISGPAESYIQKYYLADRAVRQLKIKKIIQRFDNTKEGTVTIKNSDGSQTVMSPQELEEAYDAIVEEKTHQTYLTSGGEKRCERILGINSLSDESPDKFSNPWLHYITQGLRAHYLFFSDREYIAKDGQVLIVDEFTGRLMPGRRWSDGLHQAVEAKDNLKIQEESQTLATITLQNYFRMYKKLAGMTGTAYTEANEFNHIYSLDVITIPTNCQLIRTNYPDRIYKTKIGKFKAVVEEIKELYQKKQPVLVGTTSIDDSEQLSFLLNNSGIPHNILNAKYHEKEAYIIAQAGRLAQVTIATNMAGRGTDIILGGNLDYFIKDILHKNEISLADPDYLKEYDSLYQKHRAKFETDHSAVVALGGLHIIGTQRHESRRIDNQLRGRSGRQGDPGSSRFYVSLEDDLMRLFGSEKIYSLMDTFGFPEDQPIEHAIINHSLAVAQKRVEGHNFEIRKQLLQYDNIMNKQREVIYQQRREILEGVDMREEIFSMLDNAIDSSIGIYFNEQPDISGLTQRIKSGFELELDKSDFDNLSSQEASQVLKKRLKEYYQAKESKANPEQMRQIERMVSLWIVDSRWKEHLLVMDHLREGIHLRAHAHSDPLVEYQRESYLAFQEMIANIKEGIVETVFKAKMKPAVEEVGVFSDTPKDFIHSQYTPLEKKAVKESSPPEVDDKKTGRNQPCPCGSGKKYKKCCGR
ncbi:MAG: preprotein translocase subunit SecA [Candidatus Omnitrophica bacterium]|nr:preprotein translocase subunit SecA [Candidatus Omnitrophota bacterium]